jgi:hypothetical protein
MVVFQAPLVPSAWMTNFHRQRQGGAREWLNLIKVSAPAVTSIGPPVFTSHYLTLHNFHRDVVSEFTLDIQATVSEFDLKTWDFCSILTVAVITALISTYWCNKSSRMESYH